MHWKINSIYRLNRQIMHKQYFSKLQTLHMDNISIRRVTTKVSKWNRLLSSEHCLWMLTWVNQSFHCVPPHAFHIMESSEDIGVAERYGLGRNVFWWLFPFLSVSLGLCRSLTGLADGC